MKRPLILCLSTLTLAACTFTGSLAKERVLLLTERSGREHFTLAGELPAHFQLRALAKYDLVNPEKCQVNSIGVTGAVTRDMSMEHETEMKDKPHGFSFKIPLTRHIGSCDAELHRVALFFTGSYGEQSWEQDYHSGSIRVNDTRSDSLSDANGEVRLKGMCTWLFQLSKAQARQGLIDKTLHCSEPDKDWHLDPDMSRRRGVGMVVGKKELTGKTVFLELRIDEEERPAYRNTWLRFPEGWKPCQPKDGGWIACQEPPIFKTFEMNGQECTVYPNCTE